ncbi:ABC transporter ATP-binding protein [Segnochrobactrum spirostomi]|nr:ABC transporter ATP-binding protein [Segnochrobactrum spirostomi]
MIAIAIGAAMLSSASAICAPYVLSRAIDRLADDGPDSIRAVTYLLYSVLVGVSLTAQQATQYAVFISAERLAYMTDSEFFRRIISKTSSFFATFNPAEIQAASLRGRQGLTALVQLALGVILPGIIQILITIWTLSALINALIGGVIAIYGLISIVLTIVSVRRVRPFLERAVEASQANARFFGNVIDVIEAIRYFRAHRWIYGIFNDNAVASRDNLRAYAMQRVFVSALMGILLTIQFFISLTFIIPMYYRGGISIGNIVLFNALLVQLNQPFEMMAHAIEALTRSRNELAPLATMWAEPEERAKAETLEFVPQHARISFENVSFRYGNGRGVECINFLAGPGRMTFLTGKTGSGKTTIFKIILKSIEPDHGRVLVDGVDINLIDRSSWLNAVSIVPQEIVLLNASVKDNILLGRLYDESRLRGALQGASFASLMSALPDGLETMVGERGLRLSGGERQRIAVARALYGNPKILLLDEASSALDEVTERDIMEHIRVLAQDVTVLAITHRQSMITDADNVIRL